MGILIATAQNFGKHSQHEYTHLKTVGDLGKEMSLSAGDNYIVGNDFIVELMFWAGDYNSNRLRIWKRDKESVEEYLSARNDLLKKGHWVTTKTCKEFMKDLNLEEEQ